MDSAQHTTRVSDECGRCHTTVGGVSDGTRKGDPYPSQAVDECGTEPKPAQFQRSMIEHPSLLFKVAQAALAMAAMMTSSTSLALRGVVLEPHQHYVWQLCCAPDSWFSASCADMGLQPYRVNLANGFDFSKDDTFSRMWDLFLIHRPRHFWVSMRCNVWCPWQLGASKVIGDPCVWLWTQPRHQ